MVYKAYYKPQDIDFQSKNISIKLKIMNFKSENYIFKNNITIYTNTIV